MEKETKQTVEIPDEAIDYIISQFLIKRHVEGVTVTKGIGQQEVELVLQLFVDWAAIRGLLKEGKLVIG